VSNKLRNANLKVTADLMEICWQHFFKKNWNMPASFSSEKSERIRSERRKIGPTITALLQLDSAFEDCMIARKLLSRTRLKSNKTKLTAMLRFVWQGFHHSTYIYHEKIGLLSKQFAELPYQGLGQINLAEMKKFSKKQLSQLIQSRGEIECGDSAHINPSTRHPRQGGDPALSHFQTKKAGPLPSQG
jgi:hypothetical protein